MSRGIRQRFDNLQLLDDGTRPTVRDDERQRVVMLRSDMDEVNVQPVDLGDEVRQGFQLRLALAPVVFGPPILCELLHRRELHALLIIGDRFALGPQRLHDAAAQIGQLAFGKSHLEWPDRSFVGHGLVLSSRRLSLRSA
jgi:hypothetical protein